MPITQLLRQRKYGLESSALGLLAMSVCLLAGCIRPVSSSDYGSRDVPPTTANRGAPSIAYTTAAPDSPAARAAREIDQHYDSGVRTSLVRALEILGPPDLEGSTANQTAGDDDDARYQRGVAMAGLGLVHSARAELEQVAREGSEVIAGLAEERLRHLGAAFSADSVPEDSLENAAARLGHGDSLALRTWLDDHGFVAAIEQAKQSGRLDPDLGVHVHAIESETHDRFPRDAWEEIAAAARRRSTSTTTDPFPGADSWLAAQNLYKQFLPERALLDAQRAASLFSGVAPAWSARATLLAVACAFRLQRFDAALETLPRLRKLAALRGWTDLEARTYWLEGLIRHQQGDSIAARSLWRKGQDEFASAGEPGFVGVLLALEADAQAVLGDLEDSLVLRTRALGALHESALPDRAAVALEEGALALERAEFPRAALAYLEEARHVVGPSADPLVVVEQATKRASASLHAGLLDRALAEIELAHDAVGKIASDDIRERTEAGLMVVRGAALAGQDPFAALASLDTAIVEYERRGYGFLLVEALHQRGRVARRVGDVAGAGRDFEHAFDLASVDARDVGDWRQRALFAETERELIEDLVDYSLVDGKDAGAALGWALRARTASLRRVDGASDAVTLVLFVLPDRLMRWRVQGDSITTSEYRIARDSLIDQIDRFRTSVVQAADLDAVGAQADALFDIALAPVRSDLVAGQPIDIVADGLLMNLPFAALRESTTGRSVADLASWRVVPYPLSAGSYSSIRPSALDVLVISDPKLSSIVAKGIPPLPGARAEGRSVAGRFHAAAILEGSDASRQAALRMLAGHQVLHIAAHAVPHRDLSGAASILMAGDTDGSWRADDIASRRFADLRLVVLSSCESAIGFPTTLSGPMSIGQAFLTAGAEYVLVTQWPVEDRVSRRFMETFYDQLEIMGSPERALAEAQRRFKSSPNAVDRRPKSWAGYSVATGNAGRSSAGKESS